MEEAKLMISLKNDEINSLQSKMKMIEKKSNIKVSEVNYQLQQEKAKHADTQKKAQKLQVSAQADSDKLQ